MVCDVICFLSNELCVFYPRALARGQKTHNELDKNHITSQTMGDSFYHIFTTPYLFFLTLFFKWRGVGIHDVITKIYHMSVITLISGKICDKYRYLTTDTTKRLVNSRITLWSERCRTSHIHGLSLNPYQSYIGCLCSRG